MYTTKLNLNRIGNSAVTCGWGTVTVDDVAENIEGTAKYSDTLHCMPVILHGSRQCNYGLRNADYSQKLLCGEALNRAQKTTWVIPLQIFCVINIIS